MLSTESQGEKLSTKHLHEVFEEKPSAYSFGQNTYADKYEVLQLSSLNNDKTKAHTNSEQSDTVIVSRFKSALLLLH